MFPDQFSSLIPVSALSLPLFSNNNGHLISPNATGTGVPGGHHQQQPAHQRFNSNNINNSAKLSKERDPEAASLASPLSSTAAAMRLLNSSSAHGGSHGKGSRSRSPAVATTSSAHIKASLSNPSLAASLAAASQPHDHSTATAAGQSSLISSFLTGLPASMFTPMIDMTSTQALVTLVS